ncbi:MAG: hypothetical protein KBT48_02205 [Firmicutes bacterium]|nr:hypothetical protein [Bacillota bacterium]
MEKKPRLRKQIEEDERIVKTYLKGDYFYFKLQKGVYLVASIIPIGKYHTFETFIVNNGIGLLAPLEEIDVKACYWK